MVGTCLSSLVGASWQLSYFRDVEETKGNDSILASRDSNCHVVVVVAVDVLLTRKIEKYK